MRYMISGLLAGLLVGALAPIPFVFGVSCDNVDFAHVSQTTCCACSFEDYAVDDITNDSGQGGEMCIETENVDLNVKAFTYAPAQCQCHDPNETKQYTVIADRFERCDGTSFDTDVSVAAVDCNVALPHTFGQECGPGCGE